LKDKEYQHLYSQIAVIFAATLNRLLITGNREIDYRDIWKEELALDQS
jgi:hypothetical protein